MVASTTLPPLLEHSVIRREPMLWLNPFWRPVRQVRSRYPLRLDDVYQAQLRLQRFSTLLQRVFPELRPSGGLIESDLIPADRLQRAMRGEAPSNGRWFIKADHALPVVGSIKARGGIYEVLLHAEDVATRHGLLGPEDDPLILISPEARGIFAHHEIAVGSTGNLGMSIGVMAAILGFRVIVHMSSDAKPWKKARLRALGVGVIEHSGDYGIAVAAARAQALENPSAYFVDDENSQHLFLGYSVAAPRLLQQLAGWDVKVDQSHPLFVYIPCGVGGAPGGITFGLRHLLGDHVHCFFAEPAASPCMLIRLASLEDRPISINALGLDGYTEADGLAVKQASEFVAHMMRPLVSGILTVPDEDLFEDLHRLHQCEALRIEPSAAAGLGGPLWLLESEQGQKYLVQHDLIDHTRFATHILWTTGGALVPENEYERFFERGRQLRLGRGA